MIHLKDGGRGLNGILFKGSRTLIPYGAVEKYLKKEYMKALRD